MDVEASIAPSVYFEPKPWHGLIFKAFDALRFDRFIGAMGGEGPIYWTAIDRYAERHRIEGEDFEWFSLYLNTCDGEYLKMQREQSEKEERLAKEKEVSR